MSEYLLYFLSEKPSESLIRCAIQRLSLSARQRDALENATLMSQLSTAQRLVWALPPELPFETWRLLAQEIALEMKEDVYCLRESKATMRPRLFVSDMDSTFITIEVIDELAKCHGVGSEIKAVTERAMRGEIDFTESLRYRVKLLNGLSEAAINEVKSRLPLSPGADTLVAWAKATSCHSALVSGGFTPFVGELKRQMNIDDVRANHLVIRNGKLTGELEGPIIDAEAKARYLHELCERFEIEPKETIALGDGANDLAMMREAGISFAYKAKPIVNEQADIAIRFGGLERVVQHFA